MKNLLGLPEFNVLNIYEDENKTGLLIELEAERAPTCCYKCGVVGTPYRHGSHTRYVHDLPMTGKPVVLKINTQRYRCRDCGETFYEDFPSIDGQNRTTIRLRENIAMRCIRDNDTFTRIARDYGLADKTVRRIFDEWGRRHQYKLNYSTPRVIGLDEAHIDRHFRLVVTDIEKKDLLDMLPNNKYQTIVDYLKQFPDPNNVAVATMDFAPTYANAVLSVFPFVLPVIDKFHVVQLLNKKMDAVRIQIHREEKAKGLNPIKLKHERKLFMANMEDLDAKSLRRLSAWLEKHPRLEEVYMLKEQFREIYDAKTRSEAEYLFDEWCKSVPEHIPEFVSVRDRTLIPRREHILNYFDERYTNAYTESINRKIKDIERRGKGYRFDVLRALALHGDRVQPLTKFDYKAASILSDTYWGGEW